MIDLRHGDCLEIMKQIPDKSIDLVVTDPPYKLVAGGCTKGGMANSGIFSRNKRAVKRGTVFDCNEVSFSEWLPEIFRVLKHSAHCYIMINGRNLFHLQQECNKAGFKYQNLLVWDKRHLTPNKWYMNQCEFILMLRKGKAKNIHNMGTSTLFSIPSIVGRKKHPTEKPVELLQILIENSSETEDIVLDPFMGAGSTGVACVNIGRNFIGIELDKQYFDIAEKRINEAQEVNK